jgi:hypothetical protein
MKRQVFLALAILLALVLTWTDNGSCQFTNNKAGIYILSTRNSPTLGNGTFFAIYLHSSNIGTVKGVKKITAYKNHINPKFSYEISLTAITHSLSCEWYSISEFIGQFGTYVVKVEREGSPDQYLYTDELPRDLIPLPTPENLRVSFQSGATTPTLSFDPVDPEVVDFDYYEFRIYDKNYSRRIYVAERYPNEETKVTFPNGRILNRSTAEDLIPGETYIFRADIYKELTYPWVYPINALVGHSSIYFKVPDQKKK